VGGKAPASAGARQTTGGDAGRGIASGGGGEAGIAGAGVANGGEGGAAALPADINGGGSRRARDELWLSHQRLRGARHRHRRRRLRERRRRESLEGPARHWPGLRWRNAADSVSLLRRPRARHGPPKPFSRRHDRRPTSPLPCRLRKRLRAGSGHKAEVRVRNWTEIVQRIRGRKPTRGRCPISYTYFVSVEGIRPSRPPSHEAAPRSVRADARTASLANGRRRSHFSTESVPDSANGWGKCAPQPLRAVPLPTSTPHWLGPPFAPI